ncbi:MAG: O-antigen ligase family protein [Cyanobacteria bacterium P01_G01_bin.67]
MINLTHQKEQPPTTFLVYYQGFIAVAAVIIFFTRLDIYLQEHTPMIPLYWMFLFLVASLPLLASLPGKLNSISMSILVWCGGYIAITLISILIQPRIPDLQYLENQYRTIIFFLLMIGIFSHHPLVSKWVKLAVLSVTFSNVCMYVYEFFNPAAFYLEQRSPGRSSGFYDDSNTASIALIVGLIFTIDMFKPKYRLFYALFVFMGIATTFSRGSTVGWFLVVGLLIGGKVIPRYQIPLLSLFFAILFTILVANLNNLQYLKTADGTNLFQKDTLARVEFLVDPFAQKDSSQASRLSFVNDAWKKFAESPFIGKGLASGQNKSTLSLTGKAERSHNIYLDLMVEYGFLGAFIYPSLLMASVWKAQGEFKKQALVFAVFMLSQGIFSHTLLNDFCSLVIYPIAANLNKQSYFKSQLDLSN